MKRINYYKISTSTEISEVGYWEQLDVPTGYYDIPNNFQMLKPDRFTDFEPNLDGFEVRSRAILTDVLSAYMIASYLGMFVSSKFKSLIEQANYIGGRFYKVALDSVEPSEKYGEKLNQYYFFHLIDEGLDLIDYEKSEFVNIINDQKVEITNDDYLRSYNRQHRNSFVEPRELYLKSCPDVFKSPYDIYMLVSESFLERIQEENITGLEINPYNNVEFYSD